ncbi:MAG: polysaccharide biosynthesis protein [Thiotrichaceae bacterium]
MCCRIFNGMKGGEVFVPKIPSINIMDLVASMAPGVSTKIVGIRPGEKLHEIMCPADDAHLTLEFANHYVIRPAITFLRIISTILQTCWGKRATSAGRFRVQFGKNPHFLTVDELRTMK